MEHAKPPLSPPGFCGPRRSRTREFTVHAIGLDLRNKPKKSPLPLQVGSTSPWGESGTAACGVADSSEIQAITGRAALSFLRNFLILPITYTFWGWIGDGLASINSVTRAVSKVPRYRASKPTRFILPWGHFVRPISTIRLSQ